MSILDDNYSDLDLKCDFPARESFREALLSRLLAVDVQPTPTENDSGLRKLDDSELKLLAAARGDVYQYKTLF